MRRAGLATIGTRRGFTCWDDRKTAMTEIVRYSAHSRGAPTISDTGIRVVNVASADEHSGYSPDEIVELYPALTLEDVHTALAFYYANTDEFRDAMADAPRDDETDARA